MRKGVPMTEEHKAKIKAGREKYFASKREEKVEALLTQQENGSTYNMNLALGNLDSLEENLKEMNRKLDAVVDIHSNVMKIAIDLAQLTVALAPLRDKIAKLHMKRYEGKEMSAGQIVGLVGVETLEGKVEENKLFWENLKVALIDALLRVEGFKPGTPGHYKVGDAE